MRAANPNLSADERNRLVDALMDVRRRVRTDDLGKKRAPRAHVDVAKRALGKRGSVWWDDGLKAAWRRIRRFLPNDMSIARDLAG